MGKLSVQLIFDERKEVVAAIEKTDDSMRYKSVEEIIGHKSEMGDGVSGEALSSGNVVFCDTKKAKKKENRKYKDGRYVTIPLLNREESIGVLSATSFLGEAEDLALDRQAFDTCVAFRLYHSDYAKRKTALKT